MTDRMIENRVKKIQDLEKQKSEIEFEIEKIKAELKEDMESKEVDVIRTERGVTIRWQKIISDKFDSKNFKGDHPDMYSQYIKSNVSRRFTWSV